MKFIPWLIRNSWFQLLTFFAMLGMTISWEKGLDKTISLYFTISVILILMGASYLNWRKNVKDKF
jgi:hypothetical protein